MASSTAHFGLAMLATLGLLASGCGGAKSPSAGISAATTASQTTATGKSNGNNSGGSTNALPTGPAELVDEWATCERSHGDRNQADPTIDSHSVIHIITPMLGRRRGWLMAAGGPHADAGSCSRYLAAAQRKLRAAHPVRDPHGVGETMYLKYVACMRANGIPEYPSPEPNDPSATDFIGSGVDPNSPSVLRVNDVCGKKLGLPAWWIKGWGPPGDVTVRAAGLPRETPACLYKKRGCRALVPAPGL